MIGRPCRRVARIAAAWSDPPRAHFVIAGAQKAGTTYLHAALSGHPGVALADTKEVHFFDGQKGPTSGRLGRAIYGSYFEDRPGALRGEATPILLFHPEAARRMAAYDPSLQVIVILRDPALRAWSHWNMERTDGREPLSFEAALGAEGARARRAAPRVDRLHSYVARGAYASQLQRLWTWIPRPQTLLLRQDELARAPRSVVDAMTGFLGLDPVATLPPAPVHARPYPPGPPPRRALAWIRGVLEPETRALEALTGWDLAAWRSSDPRA